MKSMTGYAFGEKTQDGLTVSVELKGYNSRFLDLSLYLPPWLSPLENRAREFLTARFGRGKIDAFLRVKEKDARISVTVNREAARAYAQAMDELSVIFPNAAPPSLTEILSLDGVLETGKPDDFERYWAAFSPVLDEAARNFDAERDREGALLEKDILSKISLLEASTAKVAAHGPALEAAIKENLRARFAELLGGQVDENRVLAETASLLVKYTISEEISRLGAHLAAFRETAAADKTPGKKLDFLCQELGREINTIGSKTPVLDVSREVVIMKNALEDIREQLRNVE